MQMTLRSMVPLAAAMMIGTAGPALAQSLDVPFVPTPQEVVNKMLEMAAVSADDVVYDLGSGDGRIVITAVKDFNARKGVGVDLDPARVAESKENAREAGVEDKVTFVEGNVFDFDFSEATVLTMYLLPRVNLDLRPRILAELKPGTRVVSHAFHMGDWEPTETATVDGRMVYKWIVPTDVAAK
jgi:ubiquinone/menaquinone biosynthesis C-methylase UbiE